MSRAGAGHGKDEKITYRTIIRKRKEQPKQYVGERRANKTKWHMIKRLGLK